MAKYRQEWAWDTDSLPDWASPVAPAGSMYEQQRAQRRNRSTGSPAQPASGNNDWMRGDTPLPLGSFGSQPQQGIMLPIIGPSGPSSAPQQLTPDQWNQQAAAGGWGATSPGSPITATMQANNVKPGSAQGGAPVSQWDAYAQQAGVDMNWWNAFKAAKHPLGTEVKEGITPIDYYLPAAGGSPSTALQMAVSDKQWGEQFQRTYNRPPNEDEWKWHWFNVRGLNAGGGTPQQVGATGIQNMWMNPSGQSQPYASQGGIYRPVW